VRDRAPFVDPRASWREPAAAVRWRETVLAMRDAGVERFVEIVRPGADGHRPPDRARGGAAAG